MKNITINNKDRLLEGFLETCTAVGLTMGSEGSFGIYESEIMSLPIVTKDGISVAKNMYFPDKHKAMGNYLAKQVAAQTVKLVGDATTTSLVLAKAIVEGVLEKRGLFSKPENNYNKKVERGFEYALEEIKLNLSFLAKETKPSDIKKIATISANNDESIGEMILEAFNAVGKEGIIDFREDKDKVSTSLSLTNGMLLNKGYVNPLLRNTDNGNFESEKTLVVVYVGYEAGKSEEILNFFNKTKGKSVILITERLQDEDFIRRIAGVNQNGFDITIIEAPFYDVQREVVMEDVAIYTGAEVFVQGTSKEIVHGEVDRLVVTHNSCSLIRDTPSKGVGDRIKSLEVELKDSFQSDFIKRRIQLLQGIAATVVVGGITESERKEVYDRVEDAIHAVKAASEEGWVAGGGSTFLNISNSMDAKFSDKDAQYGYDIIKNAIKAPFKQICQNANRNPKKYAKKCKEYGLGYNAVKDEVSNLIEDGVIDSKKSLRVSLENALSVSKLLLNIKVVTSLD